MAFITQTPLDSKNDKLIATQAFYFSFHKRPNSAAKFLAIQSIF